MNLEQYNARLKEKFDTRLRAYSYEGIRTPVKHKCSVHGVFTTTPYQAIYRIEGCQECFVKASFIKRSNASKRRTSVGKQQLVKELYRKIKSAKLVTLLYSKDELLQAGAIDRFYYRCNCGNVQTASLYNIAALKFGCRTCTNSAVNANKKGSVTTILARLRSEFPDTVITRLLENEGKPSSFKVQFSCRRCNAQVIRSRFPFGNGLRMCKDCTTSYAATEGAHSGFKIRRIQDTKTGKIFHLQGYERTALGILRSEGKDISKLRDSTEIEPILYCLDGRQRRYFPDFKYKNEIIEVKSTHTAGVNKGSAEFNYKKFRMLKAKANAVTEQGFSFRLMLLVAKQGSLKELSLPDNWMHMKIKELRPYLTP